MLTLQSLPARGLAYHWKGHVAVLLGAAVGAAVLTGALFVGDSLRGSLRAKADRQLNGVTAAWVGQRLISQTAAGPHTPALMLQGTVSNGDALARVTVVAVDAAGLEKFNIAVPEGWGDKPAMVLSHAAAAALAADPGAAVQLAVERATALPKSSLLGRRGADDLTASLKVPVAAVLPADAAANEFSLAPNPAPPVLAYVPLAYLQGRLGQAGKINALFAFGPTAAAADNALSFTPAAAGVRVVVPKTKAMYASIESEQFVLEPAAAAAATAALKAMGLRAEPTCVYLANDIEADGKAIPYSVVAGVNPAAEFPLGPFLPPGVAALGDEEIVLTDWPESPLKDVPVGARVTLKYFLPELESGPVESRAVFKLVGRVKLDGAVADPDLTPPFPGVTDKLKVSDWDPPFPFDNKRIKPGDVHDKYWDKYRTTPKAFVTLAAAEKLFGSRFGSLTSIRVAPTVAGPAVTADAVRVELATTLTAAKLGVAFEPTRERLLEAGAGSNDFGGLFLGFSFFLIAAALMLVGLLFRLNVERRAKEVGALLAIGYSPAVVRRGLLLEGLAVAAAGSLLGVIAAHFYSRLLLDLLAWLWPDPAVKAILAPHPQPVSALIGLIATWFAAGAALVLSLRGLFKIPPPALLRGVSTDELPAAAAHPGRNALAAAAACAVFGLIALFSGTGVANPDFRAMSFFGGGGLLLTAGLLAVRWRLKTQRGALPRGPAPLLALGRRGAGRFPGRSVLTVALLASATFLLVAVESFRRTPDADFALKDGGSGGYNLLVELDVPTFARFDREPGRGELIEAVRADAQKAGLDPADVDRRAGAAEAALKAVTAAVPLRLHGGDDASCMNLYRAGKPRVVGVPDEVIADGGFRFALTDARTPGETENPWRLLQRGGDRVPVFVEQNTAQWMLKAGVGDGVELPAAAGPAAPGVIAATLSDSVFQSEVLIPDSAFRRLYPRDEGFRLFLVSCDPAKQADVSAALTRGLRRLGPAVTPSRDKVVGYQAVVGSYLTTFQLLGVLGLLLGIAGVAVLILRGVLERIGEFALLRAVGYTPSDLRWLLLGEHLLLVAVGLGLGAVAAGISVVPHVALGGKLPWAGAAALAAGVLVVSVIVVFAASAAAVRVPVVPALRRE